MIPEIVTTKTELEELVSQLSSAPWLAIDTEFMRESSYYPKLCLIQIATEDLCTCIDVIALDDINIFMESLIDPAQTKIFHSARQDLEVLLAGHGVIPNPLFDTQIAASILGPDEQISYAELVARHLSTRLAKTESRTNWSKRPLTEAQVSYALDDVRYLGPLFAQLSDELNNKGRMHWLQEECRQITDPQLYTVSPIDAWKQVKGAGNIAGTALPFVQRLAHWREEKAQQRNRPRQWILSDRGITEIAQLESHTADSIHRCLEAGYPKSLRYKNEIEEQLAGLPEYTIQPDTINNADRRLTRQQQSLVKVLMKHIRQRAQEIGTAPSMLANRRSVENLVLGKKSKVTSGWRQSEIGDEILDLLKSSLQSPPD